MVGLGVSGLKLVGAWSSPGFRNPTTGPISLVGLKEATSVVAMIGGVLCLCSNCASAARLSDCFTRPRFLQ